MRKIQSAQYFRSRGFSLVEVLLSVFILGIGLIMVASVFPVGADWTRQSAESTVGQTIAQDAVSILQSKYPSGTLTPALFTTVSPAYKLQALPSFVTKVPFNERAYAFGSSAPYPVAVPSSCSYYWTALGRISPSDFTGSGVLNPSPSHRYDIYIFIFRKGSPEQTFGKVGGPIPFEITGDRDPLTPLISISTQKPPAAPVISSYDPSLEPTLVSQNYSIGSTTTTPITNAVPPMGTIGVGESSGTVFRQIVAVGALQAAPRPLLSGQAKDTDTVSEKVIFAPPADGTYNPAGPPAPPANYTNSPLIYVYQTTFCQ